VHTGFWCGNLRERDNLEDPGIHERIILRWIFRKWDVGIEMAQVRDRGRALVYMVMKLCVP
jgi:hypothetical protein